MLFTFYWNQLFSGPALKYNSGRKLLDSWFCFGLLEPYIQLLQSSNNVLILPTTNRVKEKWPQLWLQPTRAVSENGAFSEMYTATFWTYRIQYSSVETGRCIHLSNRILYDDSAESTEACYIMKTEQQSSAAGHLTPELPNTYNLTWTFTAESPHRCVKL